MIRFVAIIVFIIGTLIPAGTLENGLDSLIVTFFGLLAAGIIPAISLLVANTLSSALSVKKAERTKNANR